MASKVQKEVKYLNRDFGGLRNERRNWDLYMNDAKCVIYMVSLSCYNQILIEDKKMNRMQESINLFDRIINYDVFTIASTNIIVFLNKYDLFIKKIGKYFIGNYFNDFMGNETKEDDIIDFFIKKFREKINNSQEVHFHVTTMIDSKCATEMFELCRNIIINDAMTP